MSSRARFWMRWVLLFLGLTGASQILFALWPSWLAAIAALGSAVTALVFCILWNRAIVEHEEDQEDYGA